MMGEGQKEAVPWASLCSPPVSPLRHTACSAATCSANSDCHPRSNRTYLCCFNGCVDTCMRALDPPPGSIKMEPGGLLSLPVEVLHNIGKFLPVEDILACSATCHYLRNTFNDNIVWEKYVSKDFKQSLQAQELCVVPAFHLEESFSPLCENRITFMKKTNLVNNWKNGNLVYNVAQTSYSYASGVESIPKAVGQAIYKDRYLFLGRFIDDVESDAIEVWDINKEPVKLMDLKMDEHYYEVFYIVGDFLVVVECQQVKVYEIKISEKSLPLLFSFLIMENDVAFHKPVNHHDRHDERCHGWHYSMVDHFLFANKYEYDPNDCVFHVWDIVNACKIGTFVPPVLGFTIYYHSHTGSNWLLKMYKQSGGLYFFKFDIERKSFSESIFYVNKHLFHSMAYNSSLIFFESLGCNSEGWYDMICSVYDFSTSEKLKERCLNNSKINYETKVINGYFIALCIDSFHVIDALTLDTLHQFPCANVCFVTHQLNVHGSIFILAANRRNIFEVWDLSKKEKTARDIREGYMSNLYLNESCTKLACITWREIVVYHFL